VVTGAIFHESRCNTTTSFRGTNERTPGRRVIISLSVSPLKRSAPVSPRHSIRPIVRPHLLSRITFRTRRDGKD
jgi:hypothetical protein